MVKSLWRAWRRRREIRARAQLEDALKHVFSRQSEGTAADIVSLAECLGRPPKAASRLAARMEAAGLLGLAGTRLNLTEKGEKWALQVVRAHRLWETYLATEARLPVSEVHGPAEREEHRLTADQEVDALDAYLGHPRRDPHGEPIPTASGELAEAEEPVEVPVNRASLGRLSDLKPGDQAEIVIVDPELRGFTRRRLLDLGLTSKARVTVHLANAFGDPVAFRVRGTTIALRKEQASKVWVRRLEAPAA